MKPSKTIMLAFLLLQFSRLFAQQDDSISIKESSPLEIQAEFLSEQADAELDLSQFEDELEHLQNKPVNLNAGKESELRRLPLINEQQIQNLLAYTSEYGQITSIYELQLIDGFNQENIEHILPYITLTAVQSEPFKWKNALRFGHPEVLMRYQRVIEQQHGYRKVSDSLRQLHPNDYYFGSPDAVYLRFLYRYKDRLQYGLIAEKDAGEIFMPRVDTIKKGFDFYSAHLYLNNIGKLKHLVIGDYHVQFAQGLTLWTGLSIGKIAGVLPMRNHATAIRPHSSANEINFMRGIAGTIEFGKLNFTGFYSLRKRDANLTAPDSLEDSDLTISSILESGYHRTPGELQDRNCVKEFIIGGHGSWDDYRFKLGISAYQIKYSNTILPREDEYAKFQPSGGSNAYLGTDYTYSYKRLTMYGEASYQHGGGIAQVHGLSFTPDPGLSVALIYRNYPINYLNSLSAAFGTGSKNTNEKGVYLGILTTPYRNVSITLYTDQFIYPWLKYQVDAPSRGHEYSAQLDYSLGRKGNMIFRYRYALVPVNTKTGNAIISQIEYTNRNYYQWQIRYQATPWLLISNKIYILQKSDKTNPVMNGFFISQDLQFAPVKPSWVISLRYSLFDTDSYDTRMYAYENDVPNAFSVPALSGKGSRSYVMIKMRLWRQAECWIRYSRTCYFNVTQISEGPSMIEGNAKDEVHLMIKIKL